MNYSNIHSKKIIEDKKKIMMLSPGNECCKMHPGKKPPGIGSKSPRTI
jgi:hypothetical protein